MVVLPAPFRPRNPKIAPRGTSSDKPSSARTPGKSIVNPRVMIAGGAAGAASEDLPS